MIKARRGRRGCTAMVRYRRPSNITYTVLIFVALVASLGGSFNAISPSLCSTGKSRYGYYSSRSGSLGSYGGGGVRANNGLTGMVTKPPGDRTTIPSAPRELIEREKERWGSGTARAVERGVVAADKKNKNKKRKGAGKARGDASGNGRGKDRAEARGAGPLILRWRMFNVDIPMSLDPGKDDWRVSDVLLSVVSDKLGIIGAEDQLTRADVVIVRKSFDARTKKGAQETEPRFSYTVDVRLERDLAKQLKLRIKKGKLEPMPPGGPRFPVSVAADVSILTGVPTGPQAKATAGTVSSSGAGQNVSGGDRAAVAGKASAKMEQPTNVSEPSIVSAPETSVESPNMCSETSKEYSTGSSESSPESPKFSSGSPEGSAGRSQPKVVVIGAGPAGLFAALELVQAGIKPVIVERGMPVERRGRAIGALFSRGILDPESNLCYGEGGAGTWSDGKLTTRIGRNSENVRKVLETLVAHGAPERILVDGKPHLGTDRLVRILRDLRAFLTESGVTFRFDTLVEGFITQGGGERDSMRGVKLAGGGEIPADRVILAVGHSSRKVYERLLEAGVKLEAKGIAVGFRIEHPQATIDELRYGEEVAAMVNRGKGKVPVADYRLTQALPPTDNSLPVQDRGQKGGAKGAVQDRSCYSFCMCPGGQVVPTSVDPKEVCVNGMSFSKRDSKWANAALVVSLTPEDVAADISELHGVDAGNSPLRGVRWQSTMERRAAEMGGGNLVVPVQRVTDFMTASTGRDTGLPASSYRLGVRNGPLHEIYPTYVTDGLREALEAFDKRMPGFITDQALLHGVETRTSAPIQIERDPQTLECPTMEGLFPSGEGAGYAGGIVSAAVDGIRVGAAVAAQVVVAKPVPF